MTSFMLALVLVLCVVVDFGWAQTKPSANLTCDQLPKALFPNNKKWSADGPLVHVRSLSSLFDCTTVTFSAPEHGSTTYTGFVLVIAGDRAHTVHYTLSGDRKIITTVDSAGRNLTWYAIDADSEGGFHCAYICDGPALQDFACATSNNKKFEHQIANSVEMARQVPNGDKIHLAQENCPNRKHLIF